MILPHQFTRRTRAIVVVAAALLMAVPATAESIVIVHGAFQSAADWTDVGDRLEADGHDVVLIDLPGRDAAGEAAKAITLEQDVNIVEAAIDTIETPVTLVGHSFDGITISAVAEARPAAIRHLIYIAAYVPADGESMEMLAQSDSDSGFAADTFVVAPDYSYAEILERDRGALFGNDGSDAQKEGIGARMIREPLGPIAIPVALTTENFGSVAKAYVRTKGDQVVSPPLQTRRLERAGITDVIEIDSGHSPQATQPGALAEVISTLASRP